MTAGVFWVINRVFKSSFWCFPYSPCFWPKNFNRGFFWQISHMSVTNSHWTFVIDIMIQSGNHQRAFDLFCSLFRWHWVAGWKTGVTLGRQPLAKSLSSLYLYFYPQPCQFFHFLHHTSQKITEYVWPWNSLVSVQVWSAFDVKGSLSYHLTFVTSKLLIYA